jgi:ribonuclease-3
MSRKILRFDRKEFEERVGAFLVSLRIPSTPEKYCLAFVHRSSLNEYELSESNERLEFLGDAVLELIATEFLYFRFGDKPEGELTDLRSALVRGKNLALMAERLNFGPLILLSRGETLAAGDKNPYILANTFEAFLGAMYLDLGYSFVRGFIEEYVLSGIDTILSESLHVDPKSRLQEISQAIFFVPPEYCLLSEEGADHDKTYRIAVMIAGRIVGEGVGTSKKKAQSVAAENALLREKEWNSGRK